MLTTVHFLKPLGFRVEFGAQYFPFFLEGPLMLHYTVI